MSNFLFYALAFVVVLGVLVIFHEFGHYLAARVCGVKVLRFSIGFGRVLYSRALGRDGTEWSISLIPLGGYVKMLDEREGAVAAEEQHRAFNRQTLVGRSIIVAAGPIANFILATLLYWGVFVTGASDLLPLLGQPPQDTPAAQAGIANGDRVLSIQGKPVATWSDFRWVLLQSAVDGGEAELQIQHAGGDLSFPRLALDKAAADGWEGDPLERLGVTFFRPAMPAVLGQVLAGGVAAKAGLLPGDRIESINGRPVEDWPAMVARIRDSAGQQLLLLVERQGHRFEAHLVPEALAERGRTVGKIGVAVAETPEMQREVKTTIRYGAWDALGKALTETWEKSVFTVRMLGKMVTGDVSLKNLSGPVTIADYAGQSARLGLEYYLRFMALLSISLGVLNLLPVPVLDGGHLMYHIFEAIKGRPLSERAMEIGQRVGLSILFVLMAFAFFNDLNRLFAG